MKEIKSKAEKQTNRNITVIRNAIERLQRTGYTVEMEVTETMIGREVTHIYLRDRIGKTTCFQKHLFTLDEV